MDDEFDEWDEKFLDVVTRVTDEVESSMPRYTQLHHNHHHSTTTTFAAAAASLDMFSPPPELSQNYSSFAKSNITKLNNNNVVFTNANLRLDDEVDQVTVLHRNSDVDVHTIKREVEQESEIDRLKRELGSVSDQLANLQQEYLELKRDRDQKEEKLKVVSSSIDVKDDDNKYFKNAQVHQTGHGDMEYDHVGRDCFQILPQFQNASTSSHQGVAQYPSRESKGAKRTSGSRGKTSEVLVHNTTNIIKGIGYPRSDHQLRESYEPVAGNFQRDGISLTTDLRRRILVDNASATSNECSNQKILLPETSAQPKLSKAVGVQTDTPDNCSYLTTETDLHSQHDLQKKLLTIWGSPSSRRSGRSLVTKLFVTCAADFYALFRCMGMSMPPNTTLDSLANKSFLDVVSHDKSQHFQSVEGAQVAHLYFILTKIYNETVQLAVLIDALLDLCALENVVVVHRSLRIVRVILQYILSLDRRLDQRDNVMVEGICRKNNHISSCQDGKAQIEVEIGSIRNKSSFLGDISSMRPFNFEVLGNKEYETIGSAGNVTSLDLVSLFEAIHHIAMGSKEECIQVEAISIMNLILVESNPCLEREKFGSRMLFQTVARLLQKDVGLHVQKQAVRLLFLLLNCPKFSVMFCSGCNNDMTAGATVDNISDKTNQVFSNILVGLAECVKCRGHGAQELKLRRNAINLLAFIASAGKLGFEAVLNPMASGKINFLESIIQTLAIEMDAVIAEPAEIAEICQERTSLMREALILLNRLASNHVYSAAVLQSLTSSRDIASLTIDIVNRMSKKDMGWCKSESSKKRKTEDEIADLARALRSRVFAFLGVAIS